MNKHNIVLVGFRGAGKARFGRAMAKVKNLPFADLDAELEFVLGESIESFVEKYGWQVLKEVEQRVAHDFTRNFSGVVATGGATIENSKNLQNLKKTGVFVFLNPDFSKVRRFLLTDEDQKNRPRIIPGISLAQEIDQLWQQRKQIYMATADIDVSPEFDGDELEEAAKMWKSIPERMHPKPLKPRNIAVFSSSRGTTLKGMYEAQKIGRIPNVEFDLFVTDKPDCGALQIAKEIGFNRIEIMEPQKGETREEYDRELINLIRDVQPDKILLAGWMRILSKLFCDQFGQNTYNVHPSLLPKYAGMKDMDIHAAVVENEDRYSGCTIHKVTEETDAGDIVVQRKVPITPQDTPEMIKEKVQKQEILGFCEAMENRKR